MKQLVFKKIHLSEDYHQKFAIDCKFEIPENGLVYNEYRDDSMDFNVLGNFTQMEQNGDAIFANVELFGAAKELAKTLTPFYSISGSIRNKNDRGEVTDVIIKDIRVSFK